MRISDWSSDVCSADLHTVPADANIRHRRLGDASDDGRFRQQIRRSWFQHAARGMDNRHTVFDGDPLRTVFLHIELRAPQAGKNDRLPGRDQAGSVELGENITGKVELAERLEEGFWIRSAEHTSELQPHMRIT